MEAKDLFKDIIRSSQAEIGSRPLSMRDKKLPHAPSKVLTITGARRCGKTSLMRLDMNAQLAKGVPRERMVLVNFEDDRIEQHHGSLDLLLQAYHELHPDIPLSETIFYLDEVQGIPRWERFVLRLCEQERAQVRLSGSNAKLLSQEIATTLRGRTLNTTLLPFSLDERLRLKELDLDRYLARQRGKLIKEMREHLLWGGFPEVIQLEVDQKVPQLQEYLDVMIFRDLVERYGIRLPIILKHFLKRVLGSATKPISISKINNELRSAGIATTKDLLYDWIEHAQTIHLLVRCDRFGLKLSERLSTGARFYAIDNGFLNALSLNFRDEWGKLLENATAIEAIRQGNTINYFKERKECDLILSRRERPIQAVQVCWSMQNQETRDRELAGLIEACNMLGFKKGLIITGEEHEDIRKDGVRIAVRPFWEAPALLSA